MAPIRSVLAVDLGGTKCRVAIVGDDGRITARPPLATTREQGPFLAALQRELEAARRALPAGCAPPVAIGVGTAGVIRPDGRSIVRAPNLPLDDFALAAHLEAELSLPTVLLNDGRASAWGEYRAGAARGADPLLCLFFGTGIGIGLMVGGRPFAGADNAAGEIGHTMWRPGGRQCPCGSLGHFEAYCGGRAITERALAELGPPKGEAWTVGAVVAHGGDAARRILAEAEQSAAVLTANACTLFNPRAVVLGGGVLAGWPQLRTAIERYVRAECSHAIREHLTFHSSLDGSDAILFGAAAATAVVAPR